jgi:hydrogenase expression/formation protein HypE
VHPHARAICRHFGLDPLGALSSGVFLFTAAPEEARRACAALGRRGIASATIGEITAASGKVQIRRAGTLRALRRFARDEVLKLHKS